MKTDGLEHANYITFNNFPDSIKTIRTRSKVMPVTNLDTFFLSTHGAFDFFIKFETKSPEVAVYLIPDRKQEIIGSYLCVSSGMLH